MGLTIRGSLLLFLSHVTSFKMWRRQRKRECAICLEEIDGEWENINLIFKLPRKNSRRGGRGLDYGYDYLPQTVFALLACLPEIVIARKNRGCQSTFFVARNCPVVLAICFCLKSEIFHVFTNSLMFSLSHKLPIFPFETLLKNLELKK